MSRVNAVRDIDLGINLDTDTASSRVRGIDRLRAGKSVLLNGTTPLCSSDRNSGVNQSALFLHPRGSTEFKTDYAIILTS